MKGRLNNLEVRVPQLIQRVDEKDHELKRLKDDNDELKYKLKVINEDNFAKMIELEKMSTEIVDLNLNIEEKENDYELLEKKHEVMKENYTFQASKIDDLERRLDEALESLKKEEKISHNETPLITFDVSHVGSRCSPVLEVIIKNTKDNNIILTKI